MHIYFFGKIYSTIPSIPSFREKNSLNHTIEKLKVEVKQLREQCEELQESRTDAMKELLELKERFQIELGDTQTDLLDETINGECIDRRLNELRTEVSSVSINCTYICDQISFKLFILELEDLILFLIVTHNIIYY